jgi:predicted dehydrogenase
MALDMTPEQKETGKANFHRVVGKLAEADNEAARQGLTRRRFMQGLIGAGAVLPISAAAYFGYTNSGFRDRPVRAGLIGAGDEGGVLVGAHNPNFVKFIACCDVRPSNRDRIFKGEPANPASPRKGFNAIYGSNARNEITWYDSYRDLLANPEVELVVIALPLHLHAEVSIAAMNAGKHVLCEKLMGWNISQCKRMIHTADEKDRLLAIGHQRHYSMLYAHALDVIKSGVLGDVHHIRALWHRNNALLRTDANGRPILDPATNQPLYRDSWRPDIKPEDRTALEGRIRQLGYRSLEELVRWRLYQRTGGGLMAELGSHQLDACSIFLNKARPLAVTAVGGTHFYKDHREVEDHVYCTYEFPGKNYDPAHPDGRTNDIVVVTYSSISTNGFEKYGECVMGTRGTLIVEEEQNAYLWPGAPDRASGLPARAVEVTASTGGSAPALDSSASTAPTERRAQSVGENALGHNPPSRGYREEMEHLAYCIRMRDQGMSSDRERLQPRCPGRAAMADAIIALTANKAMRTRQRIVFQSDWFDAAQSAVPDEEMREEQV